MAWRDLTCFTHTAFGVLVVALVALSLPAFGDDSPTNACGLTLDDETYGENDPINCTGSTRALVLFIRFSDDTVRADTTAGWEDYVCPDYGGWPYDRSRALPAWTDSLLAPFDYLTDSVFPDGSLTDYFDEMSGDIWWGRKHWLWGDIYNRLPDSLTKIEDSTYVLDCTRAQGGTDYSSLNCWILNDIDTSYAGFSDTSGIGIDFSQYDNNPRDGYVDMIFMVYKRSNFGDWDAVARLFPYTAPVVDTTDDFVMIGGEAVPVKIDGRSFGSGVTTAYAINKTQLQRALCHEYLHCVIRDFVRPPQPTDRQWHLGFLSQVGIMDGTGGGNSASAFERAYLGWIAPSIISVTTTGDTTVMLGDCVTKRQSLKIPIRGHPDEYFLLENRQRLSFYDKDNRYLYGDDTRPGFEGCINNTLRGTGLFITHVDSLGSFNPANPGRDHSKHKYVDVECADGLWKDSTWVTPTPDSGFYDELDWIPEPDPTNWTSDSLDAFNEGGAAAFTNTTNPHTKAHNQAAEWQWPYLKGLQDSCTGIRIYDLAAGDPVMFVSISFIKDSACSLAILTTDRDEGTPGTQVFVCPDGDADTLKFRVVLENDCGARVSGYPGAKLEIHLTDGGTYYDTLFVGDSLGCDEHRVFTSPDTTNANGEGYINVPWVGGHGPSGASDLIASFEIDGRQIGSSITIETRSPDVDGNGKVDLVDFARWTAGWYGTGPVEFADYDYSSVVDLVDFDMLTPHYLGAHSCGD